MQETSTNVHSEITLKKMHDSHASGVFLSMYWLKSRRNWVLLSDNFSSLQYSLKKQHWSVGISCIVYRGCIVNVRTTHLGAM